MIIYVDIDNTICKTPESGAYWLAKPLHDRIAKINDLYDRGNTIIYWTARGTRTGHVEIYYVFVVFYRNLPLGGYWYFSGQIDAFHLILS